MLLSVLVAVQVAAAAARSAAITGTAVGPDDVNFLLWTRSNPDDDQYYLLVLEDADSLAAAPLTPSDPTVFLAHGWTHDGWMAWVREAKTELLTLAPHNVISIDWGNLAGDPFYVGAVENTQVAGERTARLLEWLQEAAGLDVTQVQATGHSLGAHLVGAIGQHLQNFRLPFITGLDPAGPLYHNASADFSLDPSDAEFVQVIHTDGCSYLIEACYGLLEEGGHVDFYPNGGSYQSGCRGLTRGCSHDRAFQFWVESINGETPFLSRPCSSWDAFEAGECDACGQGCLEMGYHVRRDLTGNYYLRTNDVSPFAMG